MSIQTGEYTTEDLVAGEIRSAQKTAAADTYHRGMLLGRVDSTGKYGAYNATGTYDVLNETDIPVGSVIAIDSSFGGVSSGTAVLSAGILYVNDATDQGLAEVARDAVAGLEKIRAVVAKSVTLAAEGVVATYISGSEVNSAGLVDDAGDALTVTTAIIESAQDSGILIK